MKQFDAVAIGDGKEGRGAQKAICPIPIRGQQALQAGATGQARKQERELTRKPAIKVAQAPALECEQGSDGDQFTRIEFALRMFGDKLHTIINGTKKMCNNVFGLHENLQKNGFGHYTFPVWFS